MFARSSELISMKKMQGSASRQRTFAAITACAIEPPSLYIWSRTASTPLPGSRRMPWRKRLQTITGPEDDGFIGRPGCPPRWRGTSRRRSSSQLPQATVLRNEARTARRGRRDACRQRPRPRGAPVHRTCLRADTAPAMPACSAPAHACRPRSRRSPTGRWRTRSTTRTPSTPRRVHPDASLIPAVLALAQSRAPVSGRELITVDRGWLRSSPAGWR